MPHSPTLWIAAGMLWIMDASINIAMEPFRAFVGDNLPKMPKSALYPVRRAQPAAHLARHSHLWQLLLNSMWVNRPLTLLSLIGLRRRQALGGCVLLTLVCDGFGWYADPAAA